MPRRQPKRRSVSKVAAAVAATVEGSIDNSLFTQVLENAVSSSGVHAKKNNAKEGVVVDSWDSCRDFLDLNVAACALEVHRHAPPMPASDGLAPSGLTAAAAPPAAAGTTNGPGESQRAATRSSTQAGAQSGAASSPVVAVLPVRATRHTHKLQQQTGSNVPAPVEGDAQGDPKKSKAGGGRETARPKFSRKGGRGADVDGDGEAQLPRQKPRDDDILELLLTYGSAQHPLLRRLPATTSKPPSLGPGVAGSSSESRCECCVSEPAQRPGWCNGSPGCLLQLGYAHIFGHYPLCDRHAAAIDPAQLPAVPEEAAPGGRLSGSTAGRNSGSILRPSGGGRLSANASAHTPRGVAEGSHKKPSLKAESSVAVDDGGVKDAAKQDTITMSATKAEGGEDGGDHSAVKVKDEGEADGSQKPPSDRDEGHATSSMADDVTTSGGAVVPPPCCPECDGVVAAKFLASLAKGVVLDRASARDLAFAEWVLVRRMRGPPVVLYPLRKERLLVAIRSFYYALLQREEGTAVVMCGTVGDFALPPPPSPLEDATSTAGDKGENDDKEALATVSAASKKRNRKEQQDDDVTLTREHVAQSAKRRRGEAKATDAPAAAVGDTSVGTTPVAVRARRGGGDKVPAAVGSTDDGRQAAQITPSRSATDAPAAPVPPPPASSSSTAASFVSLVADTDVAAACGSDEMALHILGSSTNSILLAPATHSGNINMNPTANSTAATYPATPSAIPLRLFCGGARQSASVSVAQAQKALTQTPAAAAGAAVAAAVPGGSPVGSGNGLMTTAANSATPATQQQQDGSLLMRTFAQQCVAVYRTQRALSHPKQQHSGGDGSRGEARVKFLGEPLDYFL